MPVRRLSSCPRRTSFCTTFLVQCRGGLTLGGRRVRCRARDQSRVPQKNCVACAVSSGCCVGVRIACASAKAGPLSVRPEICFGGEKVPRPWETRSGRFFDSLIALPFSFVRRRGTFRRFSGNRLTLSCRDVTAAALEWTTPAQHLRGNKAGLSNEMASSEKKNAGYKTGNECCAGTRLRVDIEPNVDAILVSNR